MADTDMADGSTVPCLSKREGELLSVFQILYLEKSNQPLNFEDVETKTAKNL